MTEAESHITPQQYTFFRHWLVAAGSLEGLLTHILASAGLSMSEYRVLVVLDEAPDKRLRMSALASVALQSPSRSSHTITRMEGRGWVSRQSNDDDRRVVYVTLTPAGAAILGRARPRYQAAVRRAFIDAVGADQIGALDAAMRRVIAATAGASVVLD